MSKRILIIDDNPLKRDALSMVIASEGHAPMTAVDGLEGLTVARAIRPDLIIADMIMPNMDGYDLCKALKNDPALKEIPIVVNSVMDEAKVRLLALDCDVHFYLPMAAKRKEIMDVITAALEGKPNSLDINMESIVIGLEDAREELKALSAKLSSS